MEPLRLELDPPTSLASIPDSGLRDPDWLDVLPPQADVLRPYQRELLARTAAALRAFRRICLQAPTGAGKCLARGTLVLMADGRVKPVEHIAAGDLLMGPDSRPRRVLSLAQGREAMYRIVPVKGDPYVVNASHILSLRKTPGSDGLVLSDGTHIPRDADIVNVNVEVFARSNATVRHCLKGWRTGVDWAWRPVPLDPYFLGVWLGDGDSRRAGVSKPDEPVLEVCETVAAEHGLRAVRFISNTCPSVRIVGRKGRQENPVYGKLRALGVVGRKHIPLLYKANSRTVRLQVLAGLLDTDGHMSHSGFDFISVDEQLSEDIAFLARSLGLAAYVSPCRKGCQTGVIGDYWRVSISGDCSIIPTRIKRKQAAQRRQKKRHLVHGIKVEPIGEDEYFGFQIDGDHLFLLGDFTVTHNTHLIAALVAAALMGNLRILILATRTRLVRQLHERLDSFGIAHGVIAASLPGLTAWSKPVQVASVDTLYRRCVADAKMPLPPADVVIFDEAHLALGASRQAILNSYPSAWLFGFTATPAKTSGAALRDQFDELILGPTVGELIGAGMLVKPRIFAKPIVTAKELKAVGNDGKTGDYKTGRLSALMSRPKLVGDVVTNWLRIANGKRTLVFACDKAHGTQLVTEFRQAGVACEQLTDDDDDTTREEVIARLESGVTKVIVNCFLLSYGIDIPLVDCVVLARPTRSVVLYLQAVGRGMRTASGKDSVIVIDHGRVIENLGLPTYDRDWSLDAANVNTHAREKLSESRLAVDEKPRRCRECSCVWLTTEDGSNCPNCGWKPVPLAKPVQVTEADLAEIPALALDPAGMETFYREACGWYANRWPDRWQAKPNSGRFWAWSQTRQKYKRPEDERIPSRYWQLIPFTPSVETSGWLKSQMIRWAKRRSKEAARAAA